MASATIPRWLRCGMLAIILLAPPALRAQLGAHAPRAGLPAAPERVAAAPALQDLRVLALRIAFLPDENRSTTGDGGFLMSLDALAVSPVPCDGFLVDPPPHDALYFADQLLAVANYFDQTTAGQVTLDLTGSLIYPAGDPISIGPMAVYRPLDDDPDSSDILLVGLLEEALAAAENGGLSPEDYDLVILFHAGIGQDFNYDFIDPTPLDIPSTYFDPDMLRRVTGSVGLQLPSGAIFSRPAILLPESQNHIYYGIAADLFPGLVSFCNVQTGLTGTLALLIGYALGFPPLFNTAEGTTGVGVFGLMDLGSGNGLGVIPAPPSAWLRSYLLGEMALELSGPASLAARHLPQGSIGRVTLSSSEYLLIENRLNWLLPGVDMDSLRFRNIFTNAGGDLELPGYFDMLVDSAWVTVSSRGVITAVPNYDLGLPGSGLLIWHIDEERYNAGMSGINNDPLRRAVRVVEADGAVDIGWPTSTIFTDPGSGWRWDLWYAGNPVWLEANPRVSTGPGEFLSLAAGTHPALKLSSGGATGLALSGIGPAGNSHSFSVEVDADITRLPAGSRLLGFNGSDWIVSRNDSLWLGEQFLALQISETLLVLSEHDADSGPISDAFWVVEMQSSGYVARRFLADGSLDVALSDTVRLYTLRGFPAARFSARILTLGVVGNGNTPDTAFIEYIDWRSWSISWNGLARGDLDGDGTEDAITVRPPPLEVIGSDYLLVGTGDGGILLDGFPVYGHFTGAALMANLTGDVRPELVVVESGDLVILSPEGVEELRLGLHAKPTEILLMHVADGRVGLGNGDRIHWFTLKPEEQNAQWVTLQGRHSRYPASLGDGQVKVAQPDILDLSRVYNYPNPVTGERTTIRFYTGAASRASIRIYTVDGLRVAGEEISGLIADGYNEWIWDVGDNPGGLYYGVVEVHGSTTVSALIRIAVIR